MRKDFFFAPLIFCSLRSRCLNVPIASIAWYISQATPPVAGVSGLCPLTSVSTALFQRAKPLPQALPWRDLPQLSCFSGQPGGMQSTGQHDAHHACNACTQNTRDEGRRASVPAAPSRLKNNPKLESGQNVPQGHMDNSAHLALAGVVGHHSRDVLRDPLPPGRPEHQLP